MATEAEYKFIWYSALAARYGIVVETDNVERLKAKLYDARSKTGDPMLNDISIRPSPFNKSQLWLIKRNPDAQERGSSDPEGDS